MTYGGRHGQRPPTTASRRPGHGDPEVMNNTPDSPDLQEAAVDLQLQGRRALVTAASSGIGKACAAALAEEGAEVFVCARAPERLANAAQEIGARGFLAADVSSSADTDRLVAAAIDTLGVLDILVTNVPNPSVGGFDDMTDDDWDQAHQATLMSEVRLVRFGAPLARPVIGLTHCQHQLDRGARGPTRPTVLRHLPIGPGGDGEAPVGGGGSSRRDGECHRSGEHSHPDWDEAAARQTASHIPLGRLGSAQEVGALCAYLCSAHAAYITGQTIVIDGGVSRVIW
jgi:3-oxoacyl-[acyl-carrier protein] reductase